MNSPRIARRIAESLRPDKLQPSRLCGAQIAFSSLTWARESKSSFARGMDSQSRVVILNTYQCWTKLVLDSFFVHFHALRKFIDLQDLCFRELGCCF